MLKKYNFVIFTLVFSLLFAWVFYTGYTRTDTAVEAGQGNAQPSCCQTGTQSSMGCGSGTDCSSSTGCSSSEDCKQAE